MEPHHAMTNNKLKIKKSLCCFIHSTDPFYQYIHDIQLCLKYIFEIFVFYLQYKSLVFIIIIILAKRWCVILQNKSMEYDS